MYTVLHVPISVRGQSVHSPRRAENYSRITGGYMMAKRSSGASFWNAANCFGHLVSSARTAQCILESRTTCVPGRDVERHSESAPILSSIMQHIPKTGNTFARPPVVTIGL